MDPITARNASYASGDEVKQYISALGISKVGIYFPWQNATELNQHVYILYILSLRKLYVGTFVCGTLFTEWLILHQNVFQM